MKAKAAKIIIIIVSIFLVVSFIWANFAQFEFGIMRLQIENKIINLDELSDEEYIKIGEKVSELCIRKEEPISESEHYFRNCFSRAPNKLSEMVELITEGKDNIFGWRLLPPGKSEYHMYGTDGEYNLKFVSSNMHFEVVYNKNGEKLTENNDPINMGTFNYATNDAEDDHLVYDMRPYFKWNNTVRAKEIADRTELEKKNISENEDAMQRYKEYEELLSGE
jgi:hypothetical protein